MQRRERGSSLERLGNFSGRHVAQVVISEVKCRESLVAFEGLSDRLATFTFQAVPIQVQLLNRRIAPQHFRNRRASAGPWTNPQLSAPRHICNNTSTRVLWSICAPMRLPRRSTAEMLPFTARACAMHVAPMPSMSLSRRLRDWSDEAFVTKCATSFATEYLMSQWRRLIARKRMPGVFSQSSNGQCPWYLYSLSLKSTCSDSSELFAAVDAAYAPA